MSQPPRTNPGVRFPPPILFVGGFGLAWLIDRFVRPFRFPAIDERVLQPVGLALVVAGFALGAWGIATFHRAGTAIYPNAGATQLVTAGPYRFTRNPMYTGLTTAYVGGSLATNSVWPIILLPVVLVLLVRLVIRREEAYLADAFGESYDAYRRRVGRWL